MNPDLSHEPDKGNGPKLSTKGALIGFAAIAAYFLITEHTAHLEGLLYYLPYLLLLGCPVMHLFMHRGHDDHGGKPSLGDSERDRE